MDNEELINMLGQIVHAAVPVAKRLTAMREIAEDLGDEVAYKILAPEHLAELTYDTANLLTTISNIGDIFALPPS